MNKENSQAVRRAEEMDRRAKQRSEVLQAAKEEYKHKIRAKAEEKAGKTTRENK